MSLMQHNYLTLPTMRRRGRTTRRSNTRMVAVRMHTRIQHRPRLPAWPAYSSTPEKDRHETQTPPPMHMVNARTTRWALLRANRGGKENGDFGWKMAAGVVPRRRTETDTRLLRADKDAVELVQGAAIGGGAVLGQPFWGEVARKPRNGMGAAAAGAAADPWLFVVRIAVKEGAECG